MGGGNKLLQNEERKWIGRNENRKVRRCGESTSNRWPVFGQLFCFPKAEVPESTQRWPPHPQHASSGHHALGTGWTPLHPTISSDVQQSQALGTGSFSMEKAALPLVTAVCRGDSSSRQLSVTSCLSHFASCHQFTWTLAPGAAGTWAPASAHQGHPAGTAGPRAHPPGVWWQRRQVPAAAGNVTASSLCKAKSWI